MSRYLWLIDTGHGGVINNVPQTAGKRSPNWDDGVLYEGVSNRDIADIVEEELNKHCIGVIRVTTGDLDVSLRKRVDTINANCTHSDCIAISLHSDAWTTESANGWSAYTTKRQNNSDKLANVLYKHAKKAKFKLRQDTSDGDPDKEADFFILKYSNCPIALVENFFMTNKKDYKFLKSKKGKNQIAKVIVNSILEIEKYGLQ